MDYSVKILSQTDDKAVLGGYGVVFGGRDLEGETFTKDTDFMLDLVPQKPVFYDHTMNTKVNNRLGTVSSITEDEIGLFVQSEIDKHADYADAVLKLVEKGVLGYSSGAVSHLARYENKTIKTWPMVEVSLTATPAEPRTVGIERIKQLAATDGSLKALIPEDAQDSIDESGAMDETVTQAQINEPDTTGNNSSEVKAMTEQTTPVTEEKPALTIDQITEAIKASVTPISERLEKLEKETVNPAGVAGKNINVISETDHWKFDNTATNDLSFMIGTLDQAKRDGRSRGASIAAYKALAMRLESDEANNDKNLAVARHTYKTVTRGAVKANEINQSTLANYGDEWVGVAYSGQLWESIRHATFVLSRIPQMEVPPGAESVVIPLESTDPVWYKVAQSASLSANPGGIPTNTVTSSNLGTANNTLTLAKMGARVLWTGELEEDSVLPYVAQLNRQLAVSGAEYLEHVLIDGDTATAGTTNINDIAGTPGGSEAFLILNGFRKSPLVTTTANSRDGGTLAVEDYLETVKLMGLAGKNAIDKRRVSFIIDPWTHWKSLELTEVKTQDVFSAPTIENGSLINIWGYDVDTSVHMHKANADATYGLKANSAGKLDLDTASNNTTGVILSIRWDQWQFGWRRRMTLETTRVPAADATEIVALMRFGMVQRDTEASAISYNLTV